MITLREVNKENFWDCIQRSVAQEQAHYVTSNAVSIAQAKVQPECMPLAIYEDEVLVGFLMYCLDADDGEYWLYRLMIDQHHQGKGYGRQAMQRLLQIIRQDKTHNRMFLGVEGENAAAIRLYESLGFAFDGRMFDGERIMRLDY